jgi:hypothetical protein
MKKKLGIAIITFISALNLFSTPVNAEEKKEVKRISLEVGTGVSVILPFFHINTSYRLPVMDNKLAIFADYSPVNVLGEPAPMQAAFVGLKYYFSESGLKSYFDVGGGMGFRYGFSKEPGHDTGNFLMPVFAAGIGTDLMVTDNFGISFEINASYPFIVRGSGNIKFAL